MSKFVSRSSFDSARFVHTVMQDEMHRNQRHPKLFCVVLVHSGTDCLSTYFGTFPFCTLPQLQLKRDASDVCKC